MGLTKQYLRYLPDSVFSIVGSPRANIIFLSWKGQTGKLCAVAACEHVIIWDLKKGERVVLLEGKKKRVTALAASPDRQHIAVGYEDGCVRLFHLGFGECKMTFSGHDGAISALNYDSTGMRLVSGSQDTVVIVWDIVNECGLFRLRGHKDMITQARFLRIKDVLITSSKDTFVKFWDLGTQHCFKTLVQHRREVWDFVVCSKETRLITGSGDTELRVFALGYYDELTDEPHVKRRKLSESSGVEMTDDMMDDDEGEEDMKILTCTKLGSIVRLGRDRVMTMSIDRTEKVLCCHGNDKHMEVFRIFDENEAAKHRQKRLKKAKKKARAESGEDGSVVDIEDSLNDEIRRVNMFKLGAKIRSFDLYMETANSLKLVTLLVNNSIETCSVHIEEKNSDPVNIGRLTLPGHRSNVEAVAFSGDNTAMLSASADSVKVWMRENMQCISTIPCGGAQCALFAPGDRHAILGTKSGKLQLFDLSAGEMLEEIDAHDDVITTMCMAPNKRSIATGSIDNEVKFWDFELATNETISLTSKQLTLVLTRTLKMAEGVTCLRYSPDSRLLAVALLDNTVKLFFADTLKFFQSLYGHKYPVTCLDISSDSTLLVTGSKDLNCKLFGLQFGDCHKSIFAHEREISCVQFVPKTHMFFSACRKGEIKQWDGDTFELIQTLKGHHDGVLSMALSTTGNFLISSSLDKSLRLWEKTDEVLVIEEEREMERDQELEEEDAAKSGAVIAGETNTETGLPAKQTVESLQSTEKIMTAIELYKEETEKLSLHKEACAAARKELPGPEIHPMFQAFKVETPDRYMMEVIKKVRSSELEESLLVMPFSYVTDLLNILHKLIDAGLEVELCCRCLFFLLRIHQGQITSNHILLPVMEKLEDATLKSVWDVKETVGSNLFTLQALQQMVQEKDEVVFFKDATDRFKNKRKKQKKRAILAIKT